MSFDLIKYKCMASKGFRRDLFKQLVTLSTSGFGLVAALAWNDAIQSFVKEYIERYFSTGSGVLSRFIYAILITGLAVFITYELARLSRLSRIVRLRRSKSRR